MSEKSGRVQPEEFDSIWLSSRDHLRQFARIVGQSSFFKQAFGLYTVPLGYPRIRRALVLPWLRAQYEPAVCFSVGKLFLKPQQLLFIASRRDGLIARRLENLKDLRLEIDVRAVESVKPYDLPPVVARYNRLSWLRLRTSQPGIAADLLLCVGGFVLSPRSLSAENTRLFQALATILG